MFTFVFRSVHHLGGNSRTLSSSITRHLHLQLLTLHLHLLLHLQLQFIVVAGLPKHVKFASYLRRVESPPPSPESPPPPKILVRRRSHPIVRYRDGVVRSRAAPQWLEGALVPRPRSEEPPPSNPPKDSKGSSFLTVVESCSLSICSGCVRVAEEERSRVLVPTGSGERGGRTERKEKFKNGVGR